MKLQTIVRVLNELLEHADTVRLRAKITREIWRVQGGIADQPDTEGPLHDVLKVLGDIKEEMPLHVRMMSLDDLAAVSLRLKAASEVVRRNTTPVLLKASTNDLQISQRNLRAIKKITLISKQ